MDDAPLDPLSALAVAALLASAIICSRWLTAWMARSRGLPLPPGPKPLPLIGNALDFPTERQGIALRDMSLQYGEHVRQITSVCMFSRRSNVGDLMHFKLLGQHMLVLGSPEVIVELLDKHSANTSDRSMSPLTTL